MLVTAAAALTAVGFVTGLGWAADLALAFRPHYAAVGAVCLAGMALARRWTGALVAAAVLAANAVVLAPLWLDAPAPAPAGAPTLTVLWHNLNGLREPHADELVAAITAADADVVALVQVDQEVAQALRGSAALAHDVVFHDPDTRVLLLARVPVSAVGPVGSWPEGSRDTAVGLQVSLGPDRRVALLGLHTLSPRTPRRSAVRDAELAVAASWARAQDGPAVIVGDLNTPPWSPPFRTLVRAGGLRDSLRGHGLQPTWPARWGLASVPIDHVLHSNELTVVARSTGPSLGAAHRSVRATLTPAEPAPAPAVRAGALTGGAHPAGGTQPRSSR